MCQVRTVLPSYKVVAAPGAPGLLRRSCSMDSRSFDSLTRRVAGALNRRRLVASSAAAGATALLLPGADSVLGKDQKKKKTICHCATADPASCNTIKVGKKARKKHLKNDCDYRGACRAGFNPCAVQTLCTNDDQC